MFRYIPSDNHTGRLPSNQYMYRHGGMVCLHNRRYLQFISTSFCIFRSVCRRFDRMRCTWILIHEDGFIPCVSCLALLGSNVNFVMLICNIFPLVALYHARVYLINLKNLKLVTKAKFILQTHGPVLFWTSICSTCKDYFSPDFELWPSLYRIFILLEFNYIRDNLGKLCPICQKRAIIFKPFYV